MTDTFSLKLMTVIYNAFFNSAVGSFAQAGVQDKVMYQPVPGMYFCKRH